MSTDIEERLLRMDMEIHEILRELRSQRSCGLSVEELAARMEQDLVSDEDPTDVIREMRDRDYAI